MVKFEIWNTRDLGINLKTCNNNHHINKQQLLKAGRKSGYFKNGKKIWGINDKKNDVDGEKY